MEEVVEGDSGNNSAEEQEHNPLGTQLHFDCFTRGIWSFLGNSQTHDDCWNQPVHQRWTKNSEEFYKINLTLFPDHQCGDITERGEGTTGIGSNNDIDTGNYQEFFVVPSHSHGNSTH